MSKKATKKPKRPAARTKSSPSKSARAGKAARASGKTKTASAKKASRAPQVAKKVAQAKLRLTKEASTQDLVRAAAKLKSAPETSPREAAVKATPVAAPAPVKATRPSKPAPRLCHESGCESEPIAGEYCRVHYIRNWRKIKRKEVILKERKLNQYVEELVNKYPEKYIEAIQQDLSNDKDFSKVVHDLELNLAIEDEEGESESIDSLLDNIRKDIDVGGATAGVPVDEDEDLF
jgi:hypothetical protein